MRAVLLAGIAALGLAPAIAEAQDRPDQKAFFSLYKELVETNTVVGVGSCTRAAAQITARLKAAGYADSDITQFSVPEHPDDGGVVAICGRDTNSGVVGRHVTDDDGVGTDTRIVTNHDGAENFCPRAHHNVIAKGGVALLGFQRCSTQRHAVVEHAILADNGSFANNYAHTVVNEKAWPNLCAGMDLNTGKTTHKL